LERRQLAEQVVKLENEADVLPPVAHEPRLAAREQLLTPEEDTARGGPLERAQEVEERGLADAGRAHERNDLARAHDQTRAPEDAQDLGARAILLFQIFGDQERLGHWPETRCDPAAFRMSLLIPPRSAGPGRTWHGLREEPVASFVSGCARPAHTVGGLSEARVASFVSGGARPAHTVGGLREEPVASFVSGSAGPGRTGRGLREEPVASFVSGCAGPGHTGGGLSEARVASFVSGGARPAHTVGGLREARVASFVSGSAGPGRTGRGLREEPVASFQSIGLRETGGYRGWPARGSRRVTS